jgi:hypothetical protein
MLVLNKLGNIRPLLTRASDRRGAVIGEAEETPIHGLAGRRSSVVQRSLTAVSRIAADLPARAEAPPDTLYNRT